MTDSAVVAAADAMARACFTQAMDGQCRLCGSPRQQHDQQWPECPVAAYLRARKDQADD